MSHVFVKLLYHVININIHLVRQRKNCALCTELDSMKNNKKELINLPETKYILFSVSGWRHPALEGRP